MAQTVSLAASPRDKTGKGAARQARFAKQVPAVIYGHGRPAQPLIVDALLLEQALSGVEPESTLIELTVDGKITLKVPVHLVGAPDGVRNGGGVLDQVTREVEIEVLPEHIPDRVELDVTALKIGDSLHVRDLTIANSVILTGADLTIAVVVPPRAEEVVAPTPEAAAEVAEPELIRKVREGEEGEEVEGEAPAEEKGKAPKAEKSEKPEKPKA